MQITICMILYNILLDLNNTWDEKKSWWIKEEFEKHNESLFQLSK